MHRHADCVQNAARLPIWCGPLDFCLDCLEVGTIREQKEVYERTKAVIMEESDESTVAGISAGALKCLFDDNKDDDSVTHTVFLFKINIHFFTIFSPTLYLHSHFV